MRRGLPFEVCSVASEHRLASDNDIPRNFGELAENVAKDVDLRSQIAYRQRQEYRMVSNLGNWGRHGQTNEKICTSMSVLIFTLII